MPGNASDHWSLRAAGSDRVINKGTLKAERKQPSEFIKMRLPK
jgi:hypothetical protein